MITCLKTPDENLAGVCFIKNCKTGLPCRDPAANDYIAKAPITAPATDPYALTKQIIDRIKTFQAFISSQN